MTCGLGRLKKRPEFLTVARAGRRWVTSGFVLQAALREKTAMRADETCPEVRVGFTASRKVGSAVLRNRAKRRLRSAATDVLPQAGMAGTDYVLIARSGVLTQPYDALVRDLEQAVKAVEKVHQKRRDVGRVGPRKRRS